MPKTLILAIAGRCAAQSGGGARMVFAEQGGSIGRGSGCDWVLNASGVSRLHARIRFFNGLYFMEDRSTNGVLLNGAILAKAEPTVLKHGDRLQIDAFEIEVSLCEGEPGPHQAHAAPPLPAVMTGPSAEAGEASISSASGTPRADVAVPPVNGLLGKFRNELSCDSVDPLRLLDGAAPPAPAPAPAKSWNHSPGTDDHFRPPRPVAKQPALPEHWDRTMGEFSSAPVAASRMPAAFERICRIVVNGVMDVLRVRAEIKNTFRLPVTVIQRSENNPLKFAATPEEAMQKIMAAQDAVFLTGSTAFEDAFDDIHRHQIAMLTGMRAAFDSMLSQFHPDRFAPQPEQASRPPVLLGKGRCWERYRRYFEDVAKDPDECFRQLFGEEFARAYEARLAQLKSVRRTPAGRR